MSVAPAQSLSACLAFASLVTGCMVDALPQECPQVEPGELVVSEMRGDQADAADTRGQWIELRSRAASETDLRGLLIEIFDPSVTDIDARLQRGLVRTEPGEAMLLPDQLFVFGIQVDGSLPTSEYEFYSIADLGFGLPAGQGRVRILACEQEIDAFTFPALPQLGTLAFDGALDLTAESNDDIESWCDDVTAAPPGDPLVGPPGTPGQDNPPCP